MQELITKDEHIYQSKFLPIFSHAEIQIKKMIAKFFWELKPKHILVLAISKYIDEVIKRVPQNVINRQAYIDGLRVKANRMIDKYYTQARIVFGSILGLLIANQVKIGEKAPNINTPKELITYMKQTKIKYDMWSQAKAAVRVQNYPKQLTEYIEKLSHETITTVEPGKKGITLWQKAELDIRYEKQMSMIEELKANGEDLCWISSHPDCSKRCEKWQGKLVSLTQHSKLSGFRVMKVDGHWVYSLTDIMAQKDKYGYNNNIICGFNCFDKETEVLTNNGWKLFADLTEEDLIYTINRETRISEWQKPINYFKKFYNGKMIRAKSFISDLLITPNHNMLFYQQHNKSLRFKEAKDINTTSHIQYAGQEWVGNDKEYITIGKTQVKAKVFCRLLGYYLADGSIHDGNSIKIAQQNNDEMWAKLQELPYKLWRDNNKILVRDRELHDLFKQLGTCEKKYVFSWVKELSKECLTEFLEAFNYTDGYKSKPKTINGYLRKPHKTLFTVSKQLCADLCEIALKCGYRPKVQVRKDKGKEIDFRNGRYTLNYDLFVIHLNYNTSFKYKTITEEDYSDYVYCVEVPNHTLLVKRNGFIQWCGNCRHYLKKYTPGSVAPKQYDSEDIDKMRKVNTDLRALERRIRFYKEEEYLYNVKSDKINAIKSRNKARVLTKVYVDTCEKYGFAVQEYRIKI